MYRNFTAASFSTRLVVLFTGLALALAGGLNALQLLSLRSELIDRAKAELTNAARVSAVQVINRVEDMQKDARLVAAMPQAERFLRDVTSGTPGPGITERRAAMEQVLTGVLQARSPYAQVRLIGLADDGLELARVDAGPEGPRAVPVDALQAKSAEPYMQPLLTGTPPHRRLCRAGQPEPREWPHRTVCSCHAPLRAADGRTGRADRGGCGHQCLCRAPLCGDGHGPCAR